REQFGQRRYRRHARAVPEYVRPHRAAELLRPGADLECRTQVRLPDHREQPVRQDAADHPELVPGRPVAHQHRAAALRRAGPADRDRDDDQLLTLPPAGCFGIPPILELKRPVVPADNRPYFLAWTWRALRLRSVRTEAATIPPSVQP